MSKMKDSWGDTIEVDVEDEHVHVVFSEVSRVASMELDAAMTRKFIKKLKKAIAEVEDA